MEIASEERKEINNLAYPNLPTFSLIRLKKKKKRHTSRGIEKL